MLVGILLLTALTIWINVSTVEYTYPSATTGSPTESTPWWAAMLPWQGEQQRSIAIHQGLDLQGGLQVVLQADPAQGQELPEGAMEAVRIIVDNRVNALGVTEPLVQLRGDERIIVELPGVKDPELAISTIRETGLLEFVDAGFSPLPTGAVIHTSLGGPRLAEEPEPTVTPPLTPTLELTPTTEMTTTTETTTTTELTPTVEAPGLDEPPARVYETVMTGSALEQVSNAGFNPTARVVEINFSLTEEGGRLFGDYTGANIGNFLCIVLDKIVISCPTVNARIDQNGVISLGGASLEEGQSLAIQLRYGALPVPLTVIENRTIGPTLGQDSVLKSIRAGTIGLVVVLLLMLVYYRLPGFVAALAMIIYGLLNFALYKTLPITLTLPGITGFILSVGMAVDANILVFERMKEELRAGRRLKTAMELGFSRAWPSIRDSAMSTLITCLILFMFGSNFGASVVKGFAVTLALGVLTNIFTAVTVTRVFLRFMLGVMGEGLKENPTLLGFSPTDKTEQAPAWAAGLLDIVGKRRWYYIISIVLIVLGLLGMGYSIAEIGSPVKLGIDFTSGSMMELQFEQPVTPAQVRDIFVNFSYQGVDFKDTSVTTAEQLGRQTILVRSKFLEEEAKAAVQQQIREKLGNFTELQFGSVGPAIGQEVTQAAGYAVLAAAGAIMVFLIFAFRSVTNAFRYGVAAVVAMLHDVLVTTGLFALAGVLLGWEVDALFLTAILTVIGYSVHDTIIVFDRLRENVPRWRSEPFEVVCNRSILETMSRSLMTSLSTLFVVMAILFFGGATIKQFIATIFVGIISGTYSSIFNAVPLLVSWQQGELAGLFGQASASPEATTAKG
jgi:protein-export membrane protein SecD/preprotein translocase SecF subunit